MKEKLPPLVQLVFETFTWRRLVFNRITLILIIALVLTVSFQGYAAMNNDGVIEGTVVDADGDPVENATVHLEEERRLGQNPSHETQTDANGEYRFDGMTELIEFRIYAETPDGTYSTEDRVHLHFQGQNTEHDIVVDQAE